MMRELVESRSVVAVLVGLYVLATLGAIPVPAFVLSRAPAAGDCVSVCSCVGCSPESCCCAMLAPIEDDDSDSGVAMFGYSCQPTVTWFLAILPPAVDGAALSGVDVGVISERSPPMLIATAERAIGVPTPPPKRSA